jgi:hypothetical protein
MVLAILLAYVSLIPAISQGLDRLEASQFGRAIVVTALLLILCDALLLWGSAIWYAWTDNSSSRTSRGFRTAILILSNFVGGFFYYFLVVSRSNRQS